MDFFVLVATSDRIDLLMERSLPSLIKQTAAPREVIIVNDGKPFTQGQKDCIIGLLAPIPCQILQTTGQTGAASAWNLGLKTMFKAAEDCYIAILDDDDSWDENHGELCLETGIRHQADVVISGLRLFDVLENQIKERPIITSLNKRQFLTGNPGWQGSNTFVKKSTLQRIGGFTDGLKSCNDRDLAYRLLSLNDIKVAYTNLFTATWYFNYFGDCLTSINNPAKREGLLAFYSMYKNEMTEEDRAQFIERANKFFKVERTLFI